MPACFACARKSARSASSVASLVPSAAGALASSTNTVSAAAGAALMNRTSAVATATRSDLMPGVIAPPDRAGNRERRSREREFRSSCLRPLEKPAHDVGQDAAVAEVLDLGRRVDPDLRCELDVARAHLDRVRGAAVDAG